MSFLLRFCALPVVAISIFSFSCEEKAPEVPTVFSLSATELQEGNASAQKTISVFREGPADALSVTYTIAAATAKDGIDLQAGTGTLEFASGSAEGLVKFNLLGDTNVVSVRLDNGRLKYTRELEGDTVGEVLSYVEYDPRELARRFRALAEEAVAKKRISARERFEIMEAYEAGLRGYTYFES